MYTLTSSFETEALNNRMLVSPTFRLDSGASLARLVPAIRQSFTRNQHSEALLHGNSAHVPVSWAYIELRNTTNKPMALVLSMPHYRCNRATLFVGLANRLDSVGTILNTTPLGNRFFPFLNLAFPLTIQSRASLPVLLRTESRVGFHEVDLRLSRQRTYLETAFANSIRDGLQASICLIIGLLALLIGGLAGNRLLLTYGVYLLSLCLAFACQYGYLNFFAYPDALSINAATVGTLGRLCINITVHPFLYAVIKPALHNRRRYKQAAMTICVANATFMGLHLMPFRYYGQANYAINVAMVILTLLSIGWIVYYSILAWRRAGIWSMLVVCLIAFAPLLLSQVLLLMQVTHWQHTFRQPPLHPLLIILALSYLTFEQFRRELVTRRRLQAQVRQVREESNALRRQEIEGIGRDLHDQVGNTLATALGYLGRRSVDTGKLRTIIRSAISELRFLSHNLVKDDDRPITDKVDTLVSRFNDFAPVQLAYTDYTRQEINQLTPLKQQNLYRIIQELLTNVIRHAGATQASVEFFIDGRTVDVSVEDDGTGFDVAASHTKGIGIQTIYKRAALSDISVQFDAAPTGTSVLLRTSLDTPTVIPSHANPNDSD